MSATSRVDLTGGTAVVTGASSGIGAAISDVLLGKGATVVGLHRRDVGDRHENYEQVLPPASSNATTTTCWWTTRGSTCVLLPVDGGYLGR